jgi:hypothetical protein
MGDVFGISGAVQGAASLGAAGIQAGAVNRATQAQQQAAQNSLDFAKSQYQDEQQRQSPYYNAGTQALGNLNNALYNGALAKWDPIDTTYHGPGDATSIQYQNQGPLQMGAFDPNSVNMEADKGYQFRLSEGLKALQGSQAATGVSGGAAAKAINNYAQDTASNEYGNAYQRALGSYQTNAGVQQQNYALNNQNSMNAFNTRLGAYNAQVGNNLNTANSALQNQSNAYNRLAAMAGIGQTSAQQLGNAGQAATQQYGNTTAQLGNALSAGSAAQGSIWGNALNQGGNALNGYLLNRAGY